MVMNAQQPIKHMRHMDIKHFALLDWVEQDMLILETMPTSENVSDAMTKMLSRNLHTAAAVRSTGGGGGGGY